jgi:hypothetical protein
MRAARTLRREPALVYWEEAPRLLGSGLACYNLDLYCEDAPQKN